ncbi:neutral zinc metallopeptidase [Propionibacteriaceae bacterium Y1685]|uniref:neutral zinc metallopeptidase n=1 Tax=Microlunatus sp. Y1700 TaxID=3418487 RepID=UPI003B79744D
MFPPPPRRRPIGAIIGVTAGVLVVAVLAVAVISSLLAPRVAEPTAMPPASTTAPASDEPTATADTESTEAEPTETEPTGTEPTGTEPTETEGEPTTSASEPSASESTSSITDVLERNPLYEAPAGEWSCDALRDPAVKSGGAFKDWADDVLACMDRRWTPVMEEAGQQNTEVGIVHFKGEITSPCGGGARSADLPPFYCSANQTIYVNGNTVDKYDDAVRLGGLSIMFHEYGHHVQEGAGILDASMQTDEDSAQVSRRIELQNECWTYIALQQLSTTSWNGQDEEEFRSWASDDQDDHHGAGSSYTYWFERSLGKTDLGLCNTWTADRKRVR